MHWPETENWLKEMQGSSWKILGNNKEYAIKHKISIFSLLQLKFKEKFLYKNEYRIAEVHDYIDQISELVTNNFVPIKNLEMQI